MGVTHDRMGKDEADIDRRWLTCHREHLGDGGMSDGIFAPLSIRELYVVASDFRVEDRPADGMANEIDFTYDDHIDTIQGAGIGRSLTQTLGVTTRLVNSENPEDERLRASVTVRIRTECVASQSDEDHVSRMIDYMRASGISIAYGHARSCIAGITALSPVGSILIPAVDPIALLNYLESR